MFSRKSKILCVNCGICMNQMIKRLLTEQNTNVVSLIAQWISPRVIAEDDCICKSCWAKAFDVVNASLTMKIIKTEMPEEALNSGEIESLESKRVVGHRLVCISCGRSLLKRRHSSVLPANPTEFQLLMFNFIIEEFPERNITANDVICHSCSQNVQRKFQKKKNTEPFLSELTIDFEIKNEPVEKPEIEPSKIIFNEDNTDESSESSDKEWRPSKSYIDSEIKNEPVEKPEVKTSKIIFNENNADESSESSDKEWRPSKSYTSTQLNTSTQSTEKKEKQFIVLSNYKRCADSSSRCIFKTCTSRLRHRIPDNLRRKLLLDNKYFVPKNCRICDKHLETNNYHELLTFKNTSTFTAEHMEHILSVLNTESNVDFDDVLNIKDNLFQYLFDMTKDNFINIFNDIPKLKEIHRSELGLAGFIMKYKKNESIAKLARLMNIPRGTLENHMKSVKKLVMSRMAELEKDDQTSEKQSEPIIFTPQEVLDYFKSHIQDEPCKKKKKGNDKPKTVFCDVDGQNSDVSD